MAVLDGRRFSRVSLWRRRQTPALPAVRGQPQQPRRQRGQLRGGRAPPAKAPDIRRALTSQRVRVATHVSHRSLPPSSAGTETFRGSAEGSSARA